MTPLTNPDLIPSEIGSSIKQTRDDLKSLRINISNRHQRYTIRKEKGNQKQCLSISPFCRFILIFLLILSLLTVAVVPATLIALKKAMATPMISMNRFFLFTLIITMKTVQHVMLSLHRSF